MKQIFNYFKKRRDRKLRKELIFFSRDLTNVELYMQYINGDKTAIKRYAERLMNPAEKQTFHEKKLCDACKAQSKAI